MHSPSCVSFNANLAGTFTSYNMSVFGADAAGQRQGAAATGSFLDEAALRGLRSVKVWVCSCIAYIALLIGRLLPSAACGILTVSV